MRSVVEMVRLNPVAFYNVGALYHRSKETVRLKRAKRVETIEGVQGLHENNNE